MDTRRSFGVGKSRPSARLCSVYYTAVFRVYLAIDVTISLRVAKRSCLGWGCIVMLHAWSGATS